MICRDGDRGDDVGDGCGGGSCVWVFLCLFSYANP